MNTNTLLKDVDYTTSVTCYQNCKQEAKLSLG